MFSNWKQSGLAVLLAVGILTACTDKQAETQSLVEVIVTPADQQYIPIYGEYVATTQASLDIEVHARVDGFVEKVLFREGSTVQEGELLYRIDNRPYLARVNRLKAQVKSAQAVLEKSRRDVKRLRPLYEQDAASQLDLDNALSAAEQAEAALAGSMAQLEEAELELGYTEVTAPISGLVGSSRVDPGALAGSGGQSLLTSIKQVDPLYIEFHMSALDYLNAQRRKQSYEEKRKADEEGKAVEGFVRITLPDDSHYRFWGDISFTDPQVNQETGTFAVRAVVPNPDRELLPGQYTRARLELDAITDAIVVDEKSVMVEQGGRYIMVSMPDNTVERRFIVTGPQYENLIVVTSGLAKGELVISEGMHKVRHGQTIAPLTEAEYKQRQEEQEQQRLQAEQAQ